MLREQEARLVQQIARLNGVLRRVQEQRRVEAYRPGVERLIAEREAIPLRRRGAPEAGESPSGPPLLDLLVAERDARDHHRRG